MPQKRNYSDGPKEHDPNAVPFDPEAHADQKDDRNYNRRNQEYKAREGYLPVIRTNPEAVVPIRPPEGDEDFQPLPAPVPVLGRNSVFRGTGALREAAASRLSAAQVKGEQYMTALAIYLARGGCVSTKTLASLVGTKPQSVTAWQKEDDWIALLEAQDRVLQQELVTLSAEFKARKLAEIHAEQLNLVSELNQHLALIMKSNLYVDEDGEVRSKLRGHEASMLAQAVNWNIRSARCILGADDPATQHVQDSAKQMLDAIKNAWQEPETSTTKRELTVTLTETTEGQQAAPSPGATIIEGGAL